MCCQYLRNTSFWGSFTLTHPCEQTPNIEPTWCKMPDSLMPAGSAARCHWIHLVLNVQDGCYWFHFVLRLTIYSSGLPTYFVYCHLQYIPLLFVIIFLFTSTPANYRFTQSTAWYKWIRIEHNDGCFIQYATCWDSTTLQTARFTLRRCKYSRQKHNPGRTGKTGL